MNLFEGSTLTNRRWINVDITLTDVATLFQHISTLTQRWVFAWLSSNLKCSFKNILRISKCPYSKKPVLSRKYPGCAPITFNVTSHPNFYRNIWLFGNLPIYRKLIHDKIGLVFWKPGIFFSVLFWKRYKIVYTYKYLY